MATNQAAQWKFRRFCPISSLRLMRPIQRRPPCPHLSSWRLAPIL